MVFGCANNVIKLIIFGLNAAICLGGAAILGVSVAALVDPSSILKLANNDAFNKTDQMQELEDFLTNSNYRTSLYVLAGVGAFLFLIGFLGCAGACCESSMLLGIFFLILLVVMLVQLAGTIYFLVNKSDFKDKVKDVLLKVESEKNIDPFTPAFEKKMKCCGVDGETERHKCPEAYKTTGCWDKLYGELESTGAWAIVISFIIVALEGLTLLFSCVLFKAFKERADYA